MPIIKVKDYSGADRAYDTSQCKDTLLLPLADGSGNVPFSYGVTASKTVALDFSGGDMTITPAAGQVLSGLTIPKPETLIPENIKEGVNIAGILGTLVAKGGENVKIETGQFAESLNGKWTSLTYSLGAVPDVVVAVGVSKNVTTNGLYMIVAYSTQFSKKIGKSDAPQCWIVKTDTGTALVHGAYAMDYDQLLTTVKMVTADQYAITFGNSVSGEKLLAPLAGGYWIAVAGLT